MKPPDDQTQTTQQQQPNNGAPPPGTSVAAQIAGAASSDAGSPSGQQVQQPPATGGAPPSEGTQSGAPPEPQLTPEQLAAQQAERDQQAIAERIAKRREKRATGAAGDGGGEQPQAQQPPAQNPNAPPVMDPRAQEAFVQLHNENQQFRNFFQHLRTDVFGALEKLGFDRQQLVRAAATTDGQRQEGQVVQELRGQIAALEKKLEDKVGSIAKRYDADEDRARTYEKQHVATQVRMQADPEKNWAFLEKFGSDIDGTVQAAADYLSVKQEMEKEKGNKNWQQVTCTWHEVMNYLDQEARREIESQVAARASRLGYSRQAQVDAEADQGTGGAGGPVARSVASGNGTGVKPPVDITKLPPEQQFELMAEAAREVRAKSKKTPPKKKG